MRTLVFSIPDYEILQVVLLAKFCMYSVYAEVLLKVHFKNQKDCVDLIPGLYLEDWL